MKCVSIICSTYFMDVYLTKSRKQIKKSLRQHYKNSSRILCSNKIPKLKFCHGFPKELHCICAGANCLLMFASISMTINDCSVHFASPITSTWSFAFDTTSTNVYVSCEKRAKEQELRGKKNLVNSIKESVAWANKSTLSICTELYSTFNKRKMLSEN